MKKQLPNLIDEEKIEFCAKLKTNEICVYNRKKLSAIVFAFVTVLSATCIAPIILIPSLNFISTFYLILFLTVFLAGGSIVLFANLLKDNKDVLKVTNGKLTHKQCWKLYKSGELAKWQQQFKEQIEQRVNELKGIEIAQYQKEAEEQIINDLHNNLTQTEVQLDADKVAEKVRKMITENNKNNER